MGQSRVVLLFLILICMCSASMGFTCKEVERNALLNFKHSFVSGSSNLGSWVGEDCCNWKGVGCDNITGNVVKLDLGGYLDSSTTFEAGEVNPALLELKYLTYLDLSFVYFNGYRFPEFFGSMRQLQYLNLSYTDLTGKVPPHLGNLTDLVVLDLNTYKYCEIEATNLEWVFGLEKLQYLDMRWVNLSQARESLSQLLHHLPSLSVLKLPGCELGNSHTFPIKNSTSYNTLEHLDLSENLFSGPIPHFFQNLSSNIRFLDLSANDFNSSIPPWFGYKVDPIYLSLASNSFNGSFPHFIQNSTSLTSLDLSNNQFRFLIPSWLANKTDLEYLDLAGNHFNRVDGGITNTISCLCRLKYLDLSNNQLQENVIESHVNFSRCSRYDLQSLSIQNNKISGSLSSVLVVDLSHNNLSYVSPVIGSLLSLTTLDLSYNDIETLPPILWRLPSLVDLSLSNNHIRVMSLPIGSLSSLQILDISNNNLEVLPPFIGGLSSLNYLYLSYNNLSVVSSLIGNLSSLQTLDLSHNNLETLSLANLSSSLRYLDISSNSLILDISPHWMPPFQLEFLSVLPCKLNSPFPKWILSQEKLRELELSDSGIFGPLPINIGNAMPSLQSLRLANNHINGSIPRSLCGMAFLLVLDLRKNMMSGVIPDCWANTRYLIGVELSSNKLSGDIPNSLTKLLFLQLLTLSNNSLEGVLPLPLSISNDLRFFDVGRNNLHGEIPPWNGVDFPFLQTLILRENKFNGTIPVQLCSFHALQIVDLASNNLVGTIPQCFGWFQGMARTTSIVRSNVTVEWSAVEVIKGEERDYITTLQLLVNMDLSCNHLVGVIPVNITSLSQLLGLNLSHNHLNGTIPREIGNMRSLESLDFSFNSLSGSIPESISSLDSLSKMNFSFNNLQGQIPTGRHLQTLNDSSIYMGNPSLCGDPLPKKCFGDSVAHPPTSVVLEDGEDDKREKMWLYMVIVLGFAIGFWGVIGILVVHKRWRFAYFRIAEELADWIYITVAVRIAQSNRGKHGVRNEMQ